MSTSIESNPSFWKGTVVHGESLFFEEQSDGRRTASLLFKPNRIIRIESANGQTTYREGTDFVVSGRTLILTPNSAIRFATPTMLRPSAGTGDLPSYIRFRGHPDVGLFFGEDGRYHLYQTSITYEHREPWTGPVPGGFTDLIPRATSKLRAGERLVLGISGDSISTGANASGFMKMSPNQPAYPQLVADALAAIGGSKVELQNHAVGGWTSAQGALGADKVAGDQPDLVAIAYGMNDDLQVDAPAFRNSIESIMKTVLAVNPQVEFILVAGMCGNSDWALIRPERFPAFRDVLLSLRGPGVACADVTSVWLELMKRKSFLDLTGNGVNHPNDFVHRVYAQVIMAGFD